MLILCQTWDYLIYSLCSRYYYPNFMGNFAQFAQVHVVQTILYQAIYWYLFHTSQCQLIYICSKTAADSMSRHPSHLLSNCCIPVNAVSPTNLIHMLLEAGLPYLLVRPLTQLTIQTPPVWFTLEMHINFAWWVSMSINGPSLQLCHPLLYTVRGGGCLLI